MNLLPFILNLPYTLVGLFFALISIPWSIQWNREPYAVILNVKNFWWAIGYMKGARAMAIGHVVLLGQKLEDKDLEHELVHINQYQRMPLIHPLLYVIELLRKGYRNNKYEVESYQKAGNIYKTGDNENSEI